jgi:hypothetical protein
MKQRREWRRAFEFNVDSTDLSWISLALFFLIFKMKKNYICATSPCVSVANFDNNPQIGGDAIYAITFSCLRMSHVDPCLLCY